MPYERSEGLEELLAEFRKQTREQNAECWALCERSGATEATPLRIRGRFATWDDIDVAPMQRLLADGFGYGVEVGRESDGNGGSPWVLTCVLPVRTWTLDAIDAWTDEMVNATAAAPGVVFMEWSAATVTHEPRVEATKREHRRTNGALWAQLQARGVTPTTVLAPEAIFRVKARAAADALSTFLSDERGYTVQVDASRRGLFGRPRWWTVVASTQPRTHNPDQIDAWTDDMVEVAARHGADFDGWGTTLPS